jgi:hypothetical protein
VKFKPEDHVGIGFVLEDVVLSEENLRVTAMMMIIACEYFSL